MANFGGPARVNTNATGGSIRLAGDTFSSGIGVSGASKIVYHLGGGCKSFDATVGLDDSAGPLGSVSFQVLSDGESLLASEVHRTGDSPLGISLDLTGRREITLVLTPAGDQTDDDLANWADAKVVCQ